MLIGIDWGGTKMEVIGLAADGAELVRHRISTPREDYDASIRAVVDLVGVAESRTGLTGTVGLGIPGSPNPKTGLIRNANSWWLNGRPLGRDLEAALGRPVRLSNDANCLAVSEAVDGAGAGCHVVHGIIITTASRALAARSAIIRCPGRRRASIPARIAGAAGTDAWRCGARAPASRTTTNATPVPG